MFSFYYQGHLQSKHRTLKNAVLAAYPCNEKYTKITDSSGTEIDLVEEYSQIESMGKDWYKARS